MDQLILHLVEVAATDGIPIDEVINAKATLGASQKRLAVIFIDNQPRGEFLIPVLWLLAGSWRLIALAFPKNNRAVI